MGEKTKQLKYERDHVTNTRHKKHSRPMDEKKGVPFELSRPRKYEKVLVGHFFAVGRFVLIGGFLNHEIKKRWPKHQSWPHLLDLMGQNQQL